MADTGKFCSGAHVLRKAGAGANATAITEAYTNDFMAQAESMINVATRKNWSDAYGGLNIDVKEILKLASSNLAAMMVINYDMSGYSSRTEAETMLDVLWSTAREAMAVLQDKKSETFIDGET